MLKEFKAFLARGNVVDLAVAFIMGAAFNAIVQSLVKDLIMPIVSLLTRGVDFSNWFIPLQSGTYSTLKAAQEAGVATVNIGYFVNAVFTFVIVAFTMFLVVQAANRAKKPATPTTKDCPYCISKIPPKAVRCPNCTSELAG